MLIVKLLYFYRFQNFFIKLLKTDMGVDSYEELNNMKNDRLKKNNSKLTYKLNKKNKENPKFLILEKHQI